MKTLAALGLLLVLSSPASAGVIHDESVHGDLGTDPGAPTALAFVPGGNTIIGAVSNTAATGMDRDYITFTIPASGSLVGLNLLAFSPVNIAFAAFNSGATSFVPSVATEGEFLSGIHVTGADVGTNLMQLFVDNSQVSGSLPEPRLGPGQYCFVIQQTSPITTSYSLEFVVDSQTAAPGRTWGAIKSLYR